MQNLQLENLHERALLSGDVMRDAVEHNIKVAEEKSQLASAAHSIDGEYGILTVHRPSNTDKRVLLPLLKTLDKAAQQGIPLLFPVHPATRAILGNSVEHFSGSIQFTEPLGYLDMLLAVKQARIVLTDSGGLQKEAAFLGTSCITLREETEWTETVDIGVNQLVGTDAEKITKAIENAAGSSDGFSDNIKNMIDENFGNGNAARLIVNDLLSFMA